jgi:hypothetical protein
LLHSCAQLRRIRAAICDGTGGLICSGAVAGYKDADLAANPEVRTFGQHLGEHGVEGLNDLRARNGLGDLFGR